MIKKTSRIGLSFGLLVIISLIAAANIHGAGKSEKRGEPYIEVIGKVRLVGSSITAALVISGETRDWFIDEADQEKFTELQQQTVTVKGQEYFKDVVFANGITTVRYYYLKNITIIDIDTNGQP